MKITVTKPLSVRVGQPKVNAPSYQNLAPGSEVEVDDNLYAGDESDGSDQWLKDGAGNYYPVNGTDYHTKRSSAVNAAGGFRFPWTDTLAQNIGGLPEGEGDGVVVAVLDSGITHPQLESRIIYSKDFFSGAESKQANAAPDVNGHGTAMASIINSLAPKVSFVNLKVSDNEGYVNDSHVLAALRMLSGTIPGVPAGRKLFVNMSISVSANMGDAQVQTYSDAVTEIIRAGRPVFVAAGNSYIIIDTAGVLALARNQNAFRIGTVNVGDEGRIPASAGWRPTAVFLNKNIDYPGASGANGRMDGTSPYTAMCCGLMVRKFSSAPGSFSDSSPFWLNDLSKAFGNSTPQPFTPYKF